MSYIYIPNGVTLEQYYAQCNALGDIADEMADVGNEYHKHWADEFNNLVMKQFNVCKLEDGQWVYSPWDDNGDHAQNHTD